MQGNDWVHLPPWLFHHFDLLHVYRGCGRKPDHQGKKPTQTGKNTTSTQNKKKLEVNLLGPSLSHCAAPGKWGPGSNQRPCEQWCLQEKTSQGEWWCIIPFFYQYWMSTVLQLAAMCSGANSTALCITRRSLQVLWACHHFSLMQF